MKSQNLSFFFFFFGTKNQGPPKKQRSLQPSPPFPSNFPKAIVQPATSNFYSKLPIANPPNPLLILPTLFKSVTLLRSLSSILSFPPSLPLAKYPILLFLVPPFLTTSFSPPAVRSVVASVLIPCLSGAPCLSSCVVVARRSKLGT